METKKSCLEHVELILACTKGPVIIQLIIYFKIHFAMFMEYQTSQASFDMILSLGMLKLLQLQATDSISFLSEWFQYIWGLHNTCSYFGPGKMFVTGLAKNGLASFKSYAEP